MSIPDLYSPPPRFNLPLSRGKDLNLDFRQRDPGNPGQYLDWPEEYSVTLVIESSPVITAEAVIDGEHALIRVESEQVDVVKRGVLWRLIVASGEVDTVACNGTVVRSDGN